MDPNGNICKQLRQPPWKTLPDTPSLPESQASGYVLVDGTVKIWYGLFGEDLKRCIADNQRPLVFLHGGFATSDYWGHQLLYLQKKGFSMITIDSRGHGRSYDDLSKPLSYHTMAEDVIAVLDYLSVSKFSIVGWSDGACVAFDIAMNTVGRLDRLFAFGGTYSPSCVNDTAMESEVFAKYLGRVKEEYKKCSPTPGQLDVFEERLFSMWTIEPNWGPKDFARIPSPYESHDSPLIWIVSGDTEETITRNTPEDLRQWISGSSWLQLPSVSHFAFLQDSTFFNVALENFLRS